MKVGAIKSGGPRLRRLFMHQKPDADDDGDTVLRDFVADMAIFAGEALLSAICLRIAAADGNVTFLMLGLLAAIAAALPLRDWIFR